MPCKNIRLVGSGNGKCILLGEALNICLKFGCNFQAFILFF